MKKRMKKQFCLKGHDTFVCGRYEKNGQCNICIDQYYQQHKEEKTIYNKKYVKEHRVALTEKSRGRCKRWKLLKKYNLTMEEYNQLLEKQNGLCAGCGKHKDSFKNPLSVDHDHRTSKIRGLLCQPCNLILGNAKDNPVTLQRLIYYLVDNWV